MITGTELRKHRRLRCSGSAEVYLSVGSEACAGRVANLSATGCLLVLRAPQPLERAARVELTFTINQLPFRVLAEVKAIRSDKEFGLHFPALSKRTRCRLDDLVEELAETRRGSGIEVRREMPLIQSQQPWNKELIF